MQTIDEIMKKEQPVNGGRLLLIVFGILVILLGTGLYIQSIPEKLPVMVGETWEHYRSGNPFDGSDGNYKVRVVIGTKMGYIQFIQNEKDTLSLPQVLFLNNSNKIK